MSEIKKELWKLSEKMEIEGKSNTIAGQINIMNRALGGDHGTDIADSIKKYADVAGGGSATLIEKEITENGTYNATDDEADGYSQVVVDVPIPSNEFYPTVRTQALLAQNDVSSTWLSKTWSGLTSFNGGSIWTDGDNIYYSKDSNHYILDKSTSTWSTKTWSGLTSFNGGYVWTDGDNIYYSKNTDHYVLNKSTSTWSSKTWSGLTSFIGQNVWTDGDNIYCSYESDQYVLDKSTSTWSSKTWSGFTNLQGTNIWSDGDNIYYSFTSKQYILDKSTSTWSSKTWSGFTSFNGGNIWTDGDNIYCSNSSNQYYLPITKKEFPKPTIKRQ